MSNSEVEPEQDEDGTELADEVEDVPLYAAFLLDERAELAASLWIEHLDMSSVAWAPTESLRLEVIRSVADALRRPQAAELGVDESLYPAAARLAQEAPRYESASRQLLTASACIEEVLDDDLPPTQELDTLSRLGAVIYGLNEATASQVISTLERSLFRDTLTGLHSRAALDRDVDRWSNGERASEPLTLVSIDLDGLKRINDQGGHPAGDKYLKDFARFLVDGLPSPFYAYRWAGDEFGILMRGATRGLAEEMMTELQEKSEAPFSWGAATLNEDSEDFEGVFAVADQRMYEMKRGRKQVGSADVV